MIFKDDDITDLNNYDQFDLEYTKGNQKESYYTHTKCYYFPFLDSEGNEQELLAQVDCYYRVTPGTFSPKEESDWDYLGYTDLMSWDVLSVENNEGDEVDPEKVLTEEQFLDYNQDLDEFIGV